VINRVGNHERAHENGSICTEKPEMFLILDSPAGCR
jgi:hypothetical protein